MDNMSALSGTDALSVMNATRGYGYNDCFGMGGNWFWIVLLLFFGRGFYGNENLQTDVDTRFLERDIFNTNQNVSNTACQTQRDILGGFTNLQAQLLNCCCDNKVLGLETRYDLGSKIDRNNYDNAIQTHTLSSQIAECCCNLRAEGVANTQKILDKLCENETNALRDKLAEKDRELLASGLAYQNTLTARTIVDNVLPRPIPAYPSCSPYVPNTYGYNNCGCACGC